MAVDARAVSELNLPGERDRSTGPLGRSLLEEIAIAAVERESCALEREREGKREVGASPLRGETREVGFANLAKSEGAIYRWGAGGVSVITYRGLAWPNHD